VRHVRSASGADVDIANGDGLMVLRLLAAVAANESASKSRRVRCKLDENAALGRPHGGSQRPFGYEADKVTVRADEAEVLRTVVARYLAGESLRSVTSWLEAEGPAIWKPIISESDHARVLGRMAQQKASGAPFAAPIPAVGAAALRAL
jgi:site-specific DNA recombinase